MSAAILPRVFVPELAGRDARPTPRHKIGLLRDQRGMFQEKRASLVGESLQTARAFFQAGGKFLVALELLRVALEIGIDEFVKLARDGPQIRPVEPLLRHFPD